MEHFFQCLFIMCLQAQVCLLAHQWYHTRICQRKKKFFQLFPPQQFVSLPKSLSLVSTYIHTHKPSPGTCRYQHTGLRAGVLLAWQYSCFSHYICWYRATTHCSNPSHLQRCLRWKSPHTTNIYPYDPLLLSQLVK